MNLWCWELMVVPLPGPAQYRNAPEDAGPKPAKKQAYAAPYEPVPYRPGVPSDAHTPYGSQYGFSTAFVRVKSAKSLGKTEVRTTVRVYGGARGYGYGSHSPAQTNQPSP